jgi:hypothetical protein
MGESDIARVQATLRRLKGDAQEPFVGQLTVRVLHGTHLFPDAGWLPGDAPMLHLLVRPLGARLDPEGTVKSTVATLIDSQGKISWEQSLEFVNLRAEPNVLELELWFGEGEETLFAKTSGLLSWTPCTVTNTYPISPLVSTEELKQMGSKTRRKMLGHKKKGKELIVGLDEGLPSFGVLIFSFIWRIPIRGKSSSDE